MNDGTELEPVRHDQGDIPWGRIIATVPVQDIGFENSDLKLVQVTLANGLRYVEFVNSETNDPWFKPSLSDNDSFRLYKGNLTDQYKLIGFLRADTTGDNPGMYQSGVKKEINASSGAHSLKYEIDPQLEYFQGTYTHNNGRLLTSIRMRQPRATVPTGLQAEQGIDQVSRKVNFEISMSNVEQDQVNFAFDQNGALQSISIAGRKLLDESLASPEQLAIEEGTQRGIITLEAEQLQSDLSRSVVRQFLGIEFSDSLVLDTRHSLLNIIRNIDDENPNSPTDQLLFVGATKPVAGRLT